MIFIIWLVSVPLKHRQNMANKDVKYGEFALERKKSKKRKPENNQTKSGSVYTAVPVTNIEAI